jgi:hypothetical protein
MHEFLLDCNILFYQINTCMSIPETAVAQRNPNPYNINDPIGVANLESSSGSTPPGPIGVQPHFLTPTRPDWPGLINGTGGY